MVAAFATPEQGTENLVRISIMFAHYETLLVEKIGVIFANDLRRDIPSASPKLLT